MSSSTLDLGNRRKDVFKKNINTEDCGRKRSEVQNNVRKNKRHESLHKRRFTRVEELEQRIEGGETVTNAATEASGKASQNLRFSVDVSSLPEIQKIFFQNHENVTANNFDLVYDATRTVRKLLSRASKPPVQEVVKAGILPCLVNMLKYMKHPKLQFEAAWALTNIGSTELTESLVKLGSIERLVPLLVVGCDELREQAAWCLGNIAGDCTDFRDKVLDAGALQGLMANLNQPFNIEMKRNTMWTISNLCRGKPYPDTNKMNILIPMLAKIMQVNEDMEVLADCSWAFTYLSEGDNQRIDYVAESGVVKQMIGIIQEYLTKENGAKVISPCLRALGNILTGSDKQTQIVLDAGFLRILTELITHPKRSIVKEACWAASNITAGTMAQVGSFLAMPGLPEAVVNALVSETFDIKKEAHWAIANICTNGSAEHVQCIVERHDVIPPLCELLDIQDVNVVQLSLDALDSVLKVDPERYGIQVEECNGLESIEVLMEHDEERVHERANKLIEDYFQLADDEDEEDNGLVDFSTTSHNMGGGDENFNSSNILGTNNNLQFHKSEAFPNNKPFCFNPSGTSSSDITKSNQGSLFGTQRQLNF